MIIHSESYKLIPQSQSVISYELYLKNPNDGHLNNQQCWVQKYWAKKDYNLRVACCIRWKLYGICANWTLVNKWGGVCHIFILLTLDILPNFVYAI